MQVLSIVAISEDLVPGARWPRHTLVPTSTYPRRKLSPRPIELQACRTPPDLRGRGGGPVDIPAVAGFSLACAGAGTLAIEVKIRGWWGFVTSTTDLFIVLGLLVLSTLLSVWAFERAEGWWRVLAFAGAAVSLLAVAALVVLAALRLLVEFPGVLSEDSNRQRRRRRGSRRRR